MAHERPEHPQVCGELGRQAVHRTLAGTREKLASRHISGPDDFGDASKASLRLAKRVSACQRVGHNDIYRGIVAGAKQRPRAVLADDDQSSLSERGSMPGYVGLAFAQELRQLSHREFLFRGQRQKPQANGLG